MAGNDPNGDFWTDVIEQAGTPAEIPLDENGVDFDPITQVQFDNAPSGFFVDMPGHFASGQSSMRTLTEASREATALPLPALAGARVAFKANVGSVLSYSDVPHPACEGTVVTVKTADGPATHQGSDVFVLWDDSKFRIIRAEHLKHGTPRKTATNYRMFVSDLGDISALFGSARTGSDELIHKATKDLWSVKKDGGGFVIERLFDDTGKPLKV